MFPLVRRRPSVVSQNEDGVEVTFACSRHEMNKAVHIVADDGSHVRLYPGTEIRVRMSPGRRDIGYRISGALAPRYSIDADISGGERFFCWSQSEQGGHVLRLELSEDDTDRELASKEAFRRLRILMFAMTAFVIAIGVAVLLNPGLLE